MIWIVLIEGGFARRCHHHGYPFPTPTPTPTYETWKKGNHYRTYFPAPSWCESTLSYRRQAGTSVHNQARGRRGKNIGEEERCVCGGRCVPVQKMIQRADKSPWRWSHSSLLGDTPSSVNLLERCQPVETRWGGSLGALALLRMVIASGPWKPGWGFEIMV